MAFFATHLLDPSLSSLSSDEITKGEDVLLYFWNSRCTRCPSSLCKVTSMAESGLFPRTRFVCLSLSTLRQDQVFMLEEGERRRREKQSLEEAMQLVGEDSSSSVDHLFLDFDQKEKAKSLFQCSTLPFCVHMRGGRVVYKGDPHNLTL